MTMTVPFNFATQSGNIPLSELDANFANVSAHATTATYVTGNNQSNITDVGTLNSLSAYGNVTAGNVSTNGIVRANAVIGVNYTGTNVSVTGNITGSNISATNYIGTTVSVTGNVTGGNVRTGGIVSATGNITGGNVLTGNLTVNNISSDDSTYVTVTNGLEIFGELISEALDVTGNAIINNLTVTGNFIGTDITVNSIKNGSSNVDITNTNGNITIGVDGVSNVLVVTSTGANVAGTINATGNITAGNLESVNLLINRISSDDSTAVSVLDDLSVHGDIDVIGDVSATGNVTGGNLILPSGGKIRGDFGASVAAGRTIFQTSFANGSTILTAVPNGTGTTAGLVAYNTSDTVNYIAGAIIANTTAIAIRSQNVGSAAPLPILVEISNVVRATFDTNGNVGIGNTTPVDRLSVSGNAYVSGNITGGNIISLGASQFGSLSIVGNITGGNIVNANGNGVGNIGSSSAYFNTVFAMATSAQYADLAEKYLADAEYEIGTVLAVGGNLEVTACTIGDRAIGAVSENPAYKMNDGLDNGTYVALKGRVPVKVTGPVRKGQRLVAHNNGCAVAGEPHTNDVFAVALESNDSIDVKLIEAVIL